MPVQQNVQSDDHRFMAAAIRLASRHNGRTRKNPSVGTLVVRDDGHGPYIAGRGVTAVGGRPHAEAEALKEAGSLARGATVYVTLEPCSHYGQTPPCAHALVKAGVARVVIAADDPDSRVNGKGIAWLRQAGVAIVRHVLCGMAEDGLAAYLCGQKLHRPEVVLKLAVSADGFIGRAGDGNVCVSGAVSRAQAHLLRAEHDAILVGIETAAADDPMLDCRLPGLEARSPVRIVLDSCLRLSPYSRLAQTAKQHPVWVICGRAADLNRGQALQAAGCRLLRQQTQEDGIELHSLLAQLGREGIQSLLVEGGAKVAASFWNSGLVDRLILFQSPLMIGEGGYRAPDFTSRLKEYTKMRLQQFGEDCCVEWKREM